MRRTFWCLRTVFVVMEGLDHAGCNSSLRATSRIRSKAPLKSLKLYLHPHILQRAFGLHHTRGCVPLLSCRWSSQVKIIIDTWIHKLCKQLQKKSWQMHPVSPIPAFWARGRVHAGAVSSQSRGKSRQMACGREAYFPLPEPGIDPPSPTPSFCTFFCLLLNPSDGLRFSPYLVS